MKDKDALLTKVGLSLLSALCCLGAGYFTFDNRVLGLAVGAILAGGIIYRTYRSTIQIIQNKDAEVIFNGFNFRGTILYIGSWATMTYLFYADNKGFHYLFYGLFSLLLAIDEGLKLLIFDYSRKLVTGLFDDKEQQMSHMTIDYLEDDKIQITDKTGFFQLRKTDFTASNWARLIENLERTKKTT